MKKKAWPTYLLWILFPEAVGLLAGWLTREGARVYSTAIVKPLLSPPPIAFPIAWGILYLLMGIGVARVYLHAASPHRTRGIRLFLVQLAMNFAWCFLFFQFRVFAAAFFWLLILLALVIWMAVTFRRADRLAAGLQIPYVLWLAFAGYLSLRVWMLN